MTAAEVLAETRRRGILLSVRGDRLRYDAPVGVMQAELRAALVEHKAELLTLLGSDPHRGPEATERNPARLYPHLGRRVSTPRGAGRLWQAFGERAGVVLDADAKRVSFFLPEQIFVGAEAGHRRRVPPGAWGDAAARHFHPIHAASRGGGGTVPTVPIVPCGRSFRSNPL